MENKFSIKEKILQVAKYKGFALEDFCEKIGMTYGNFKGKAKETPINSTSIANILAIVPDLNLNWLLTGEGEMFLGQQNIKSYNIEEIKKLEVNEPRAKITNKQTPLVTVKAAAGFGTDDFAITDQDIEAFYVVPDFNGIDFMIRVKGSSMYPKYSSGDIIACRKLHNTKFIQWNKCHVIATREQGILVKRLKKGTTDKSITAISDNKEYDPFEIPLDEVTGIALVVGVIRLE